MKPYTISKTISGSRVLLPIQIEGAERKLLPDALRGDSVVSVSIVESHSLDRTWFARTLLASGRCLEFTSSTTEVGNWVDFGTLNIKVCNAPPSIDKKLSTYPLKDFVVKQVSLLIVEDGGVVIEAGIVLSESASRELAFIAGEIPGSFSIRLPGHVGDLDLQFPLDRYRRVEFKEEI